MTTRLHEVSSGVNKVLVAFPDFANGVGGPTCLILPVSGVVAFGEEPPVGFQHAILDFLILIAVSSHVRVFPAKGAAPASVLP